MLQMRQDSRIHQWTQNLQMQGRQRMLGHQILLQMLALRPQTHQIRHQNHHYRLQCAGLPVTLCCWNRNHFYEHASSRTTEACHVS